jgi:ABC-2 type transport system ATP-binding protein
MIWQSWGHSDSTPAPGEIDLGNPDPASQYETMRVANWFDHYLRNSSVGTGPNFAYFRDWVNYSGIATPAYATSATFPVGTARAFYLSGGQSLVGSASAVTQGSQAFTTPPAGAPTSLDPVDVIGSYTGSLNETDLDAPGSAASWTTSPLAASIDVAGSPTLTVKVVAPTAIATQPLGPAGQLVLFVKVEDVAPDGTASLIRGQVAPIRVVDAGAPIKVTLPGIVHRFAAGHQIRLVIAGGSTNYRGGLSPTAVVVQSGAGQVLTLPSVP